MIQNKVLIIDDDIELCSLLEKCLFSEGISANIAHAGAKGLSLLREGGYHLIVLDVMLPDISGFSLLEQIRNSSNVPVLMLTAKNEEDDKVSSVKFYEGGFGGLFGDDIAT